MTVLGRVLDQPAAGTAQASISGAMNR